MIAKTEGISDLNHRTEDGSAWERRALRAREEFSNRQ